MDHVLVGSDANVLQTQLGLHTRNAISLQDIHEEQVVVGAGNEHSPPGQFIIAGLGVRENALNIGLEGWLKILEEGHRFRGDDVLEGATLRIREDGLIDLPSDFFVIGKNDATSRTP